MFSLISSRALVAPFRGFRGSLSAPWWRVCVGSALAAGACRWRVRASSRSFSGFVVVVGFPSLAAAQAFASSWSGWCGLSVAVRRFVGRDGSAVFGVSVPVAASVVSAGVPVALPSSVSWVGA